MPDFAAKQGDTSPTWSDTLTYSDGTAANLSGATITFVMRARSANAVTTSAAATVVSAVNGTVSYTPTTSDTANAGMFAAYWKVVFSGGTIQRFPTRGYLTVEIEENLETANQTIVELDDLKDYLNLPSTDRTHDNELLRFLRAAVPVIENIVGPVLPRIITNETYRGGTKMIVLRKRPVISVSSVVEYLGPIAYNLQQVETPDQGTTYSFSLNDDHIVRRTAGGGTQAFQGGIDGVWVTYTAGRLTIPDNIRMGACELVKDNYDATQQGGAGRIGNQGFDADVVAPGPTSGPVVSYRVRQLLGPSRKHPATA